MRQAFPRRRGGWVWRGRAGADLRGGGGPEEAEAVAAGEEGDDHLAQQVPALRLVRVAADLERLVHEGAGADGERALLRLLPVQVVPAAVPQHPADAREEVFERYAVFVPVRLGL